MANLGDIGTAVVTVELDFTRAMQEAARTGEKLPPIDLKVDLDQGQVDRELGEKIKVAEKSADGVDVKVKFDKSQVSKALATGVKDGADDAEPKTRKRFDALGKSSAFSFFSGFTKRFQGLKFAERLTGLIKPAALVAALGLVAQAFSVAASAALSFGSALVSAATGGVALLVSALAPLAGALVAIPDILLTVKVSMGVFKLATDGVTDALGGLNDAVDPKKLALLSPPAQKFVKLLDSMKPRIKELQLGLQNALFTKLSDSLRVANPLFDAIQPVLENTASRLGSIANSAALLVASMKDKLVNILSTNNKLITILGDGALNLASAFVTVLDEARPLVLFMARSARIFSGVVKRFIDAKAASGGIAKFFGATQRALADVVSIFGSIAVSMGRIFGVGFDRGIKLLDDITGAFKRFADFTATATAKNQLKAFFDAGDKSIRETSRLLGGLLRGLTNVFKIGFDVGSQFLTELADASQSFADFTNSAKGKNTITKFFDDSKDSVHALALLVRDAVKGFLKLGSKDNGLAKTIGKFRKELLPALFDLITVTTRDFLPVLIPALANLAKVFIDISGTSGPLNFVVKTLGRAAGEIHKLVTAYPILLKVFFALGVLASLGASLSALATVFGAVTTALDALVFVVGAFVSVFGAIPLAVAAAAVAFEIIGVKFWTAFGGMLKAEYDLFIATYRTSAAFKFFAGVITSWGIGVRVAIMKVKDAFDSWKVGVKLALAAVASAFGWLKAQIANWWSGVQIIFTAVVTGITGLGGKIKGALSGIDLYHVGTAIMGTFERGLKAGFESIKDFILTIPHWIKAHKGPLSVDKKLLYPAGLAIMHGFDKGLHQKYKGVQSWVNNIGGFFQGAFDPSNLDIAGVLLGTANLDKLSGALGAAFDIPLDQIKQGGTGFLHPTSGWADTFNQVKLIEKLFHVGMTSGLRSYDTVAGPAVSQHVLGQAADFGDSRASHPTLTHLAEFASRLHRVFKQVIWLNHLWSNGKMTNTFIPKHMDHVHLGWQGRAAGGQVSKGRPYQWNERGKETLVPHQNGYVMNAGRTKELVGAIRALAQKPSGSSSQNAEIHVHSNAADPRAVASMTMASLGGVFARA